MAKDKTKAGVPNKHLHARISYLEQAAKCLATAQNSLTETTVATPMDDQATQQKDVSNSGLELTLPASSTLLGERERNAESKDATGHKEPSHSTYRPPSFGGLPLLLSSHLAQVARRSQIRLHPSIKHSICKRCSTPLVDGQTCKEFMENLSKNGRKPQADVLVLECTVCGALKRWPVGAKRQERKTVRKSHAEQNNPCSNKVQDTGREG